VNPGDIRAKALALLKTIAPEIEPESLVVDQPLRRQVDLDSMDWLNFLVALHKHLGVDIPEADYRQLATINDLVGYLARRLPG
jgi:acyl carrier protein